MMKYACALFRIQGGDIILIALYNVFLNGTSYVEMLLLKRKSGENQLSIFTTFFLSFFYVSKKIN